MKTIFTKSTGRIASAGKKLLSLAAVTAIATVPFLGAATVAQADPPRHAPAWGYRDKDHGKNRRDDRRDRRDDRRDRRDRRNRYESFSGTVTRVKGSREFDLRDGGKTYNVFLNDRAPRGLDRGDVVRVYGERSGSNDIRNARVVIVRNR